MKKSLFALASLSMLVLGSCSNEELMPENGNGNGGGNVSFTVSLPQGMQSRAFAEAESAKTLTWVVYETGSKEVIQQGTKTSNGDRTFDLHLDLIRGKSYDFIFWADKGEGSPYTYDAATQTITVDYTNAAVNDDSADAFFNVVKNFEVTGAASQPVELRRPFAQINVGTSDLKLAENAGTTVSETTVTVKGAYTKLNLLTGIASEATEEAVVFKPAGLPQNETFPYSTPTTTYDYLAMVYVLTGTELEADDVQKAQSELFDVKVDIKCNDGHTLTLPVDNAPVQRNYRTNIFGALLTSPLDFDIIIVPDHYGSTDPIEFDSEGFRIATSLENALAIVAAGSEAVAVEGEMLAQASARSLSRATAPTVEFLLNKAVEHQKIKINGTAAANVRVAYGDLAEGAVEAPSHMFTLVVAKAAKGVELDLEGAKVAVEGKVDAQGNKASVEELVITNAEGASINGTVAVENVSIDENANVDVEFEGDVTIGVSTVEDFVAALGAEAVTELNVNADLNLTACTPAQLTVVGKKDIKLADDITLLLDHNNYITINYDCTITGNGTISNELAEAPSRDAVTNAKQLLVVNSGTLVVENVTLINDRNYHYHGPTWNSSCIGHYPKANITLKGVTAYSGMFVICCYNRQSAESIINMTDCYIESNSSTEYGTGNWAYATRISGKKAVITNCTVVGIQGALSIDYCDEAIINGGDYYTHYLDEDLKTGNCYGAVYVTGESIVTILDGKFYSPNTTTCVRSGDNDVNFPTGSITVKGGRYNYKPWNHVTKEIYEPVDGYIYEQNTGADKDRYPWVVVKD